MAALEQQGADLEQDLTIAIEDDERLHALNLEFLAIDAPTDVLSFPAGDGEIDPETGVLYLGDIIISYPRALEQATSGGHPVMHEIQLLVVHGVLHLLGHDHAEPEEKAEMWAAQREALLALGIELP
jgi:probable rRNA maturation factor